MTETERLLAAVTDKKRQSEEQYMLTSTRFLSLGERSAVSSLCKGNELAVFWGGYPEAERTALFFFPEYMEPNPEALSAEDMPFALLTCRVSSAAKVPSHRDFLGSLLALGIERDVIGDILVHENGADIIIMKSISDYLLANYEKAGRTPLKCTAEPIEKLTPPQIKTQFIRESIASVRLDNIICAVFGLSRSDAAAQIARGYVFVNDTEASKPDARLYEGDKIVVRGFGKAYFREISGTTRKGRLSVIFEKYI